MNGLSRSSIFVSLTAVVVAAAGYGILVVAAPYLGAERYAIFAAFWSALYLGVGSIFGMQQEVTREVSFAVNSPGTGPPLLSVAGILGAALGTAVFLSSPLWSGPAFGADGTVIAGLIAVGLVLYSGHATTAGALGGSNRWGIYSILLLAESLTRLVMVLLVVSIPSWDGAIAALAVATVIAMGVWTVLLIPRPTRGIVYSRSTAGWRGSLSKLGKATGSSVASAVLVTGFPFLITLTARNDEGAVAGVAILILTLTRAPLLLPLNALLGILIASFARDRSRVRRQMILIVGLIASATLLLAIAAWYVGSPLIEWVFGESFRSPPAFVASCVVAAGLIGVVTITGGGLLAIGRHGGQLAGWISAAVVAVVVLILPIDNLYVRVIFALLSGPTIALIVHLAYLRRSLGRQAAA